MRLIRSGNVLVLGGVLALLVSSVAVQADEMFDDFDSGDYCRWDVASPFCFGDPLAPAIVESPEGYALKGVSSAPAYLVRPLPWRCVGEVSIEMCARSDGWRIARLGLFSDCGESYSGLVYGENDHAVLELRSGGQTTYHGETPVDGNWHDFKWMRDANGWWSLSIDGVVVNANFLQDDHLTSFDRVGIEVSGVPTEIEWVRVRDSIDDPCPGDFDHDGDVDVDDLLLLLANWGPCI